MYSLLLVLQFLNGVYSNRVVLSLDVLLEGAKTGSAELILRKGQTTTQAATEFCDANGFLGSDKEELIPQLVRELETAITAEAGRRSVVVPAEIDGVISEIRHEAGNDIETESTTYCQSIGLYEDTSPECSTTIASALWGAVLDSMAEDITQLELNELQTLQIEPFELTISLDNAGPIPLIYDGKETPSQSAEAFCSLAMSGTIEPAYNACLNGVTDAIKARIKYLQTQNIQEEVPALSVLYTVPINLNGVETALDVVKGKSAAEMARSVCLRPDVGMRVNENGEVNQEAINDCIKQLSRVASKVLLYHSQLEDQQDEEQEQPTEITRENLSDGSDTVEGTSNLLDIPFAIAGKTYTATVLRDETVVQASNRFCEENKDAILEALDSTGDDVAGIINGCPEFVAHAISVAAIGLIDLVETAEQAAATGGTLRLSIPIQMETEGGRIQNLNVWDTDTAASAALSFLTSHNMNLDLAPQLEKLIQDRLTDTSIS